jgi:uncharacterized integral membrane protein (TIGR00698 family)
MVEEMKLSEDWGAFSLGVVALSITSTRVIAWLPKINKWNINPSEALKNAEIPFFILLALFLLALTSIAIFGMKESLKKYCIGFPLIFLLSFFGRLLSNQKVIHEWGIEYVIWALILGLLISNTIGVPMWLKPAIKTELFIKTGLVILGAEILFQTILAAGTRGMIQAIVVVLVVWYFCYFLSIKLGLTKSFSAILATGVSICGVSAAIAAGGAIKGDKKEVSYTISIILLVAIPMVILMPLAAKMMNLPDAVAGAWIGGTIDTTPAVVAAGALYSDKAMAIASIVKMSQNVLIGVAAFMLALYWSFEKTSNKKPSPMEIWYRFPKFILGFIIASIFFSLILTPMIGGKLVSSIINVTKELRAWLFTMAFVCIGLDTKFSELVKIGRGRPLYVFLMAQAFNIIFTLIVAYILFGR